MAPTRPARPTVGSGTDTYDTRSPWNLAAEIEERRDCRFADHGRLSVDLDSEKTSDVEVSAATAWIQRVLAMR